VKSLNEIISDNVKHIRANNRITQKELAQRTGINVCNLSAIENAKVSMRITTLERLADALGVSPALLVTMPEVKVALPKKRQYTHSIKKRKYNLLDQTKAQLPETNLLPTGSVALDRGGILNAK
jgi:transcriptional regulator with XRE-family HTH domain